MRVHFVALLAAIAAISTSDGVSVTTNSKLTTSRFAVAANTKRFLRTETFSDEAEERGIKFDAIPGIGAIKKTFNASPSIGAIKNIFSKKVTLEDLLAYAKKNKPPSYVFKRLNLDKVDATMLVKNSDFNVWVAYVRLVNPRHAESDMITFLTARYGDEVVAKMIQAALKDTKTEEIAKALQSTQLEGWKNVKFSNDGVFKLLQLNHGVDDLLENPNLIVWLKYVDYIGKHGLDDEAIMIKTFVAHYSDEALSTMLISAKRAPATEVVASKLQTELLKVWQSSNKSPEDVFTLLKFDLDGLLVNPMLKTWTKYLDDFNVNNPMSKKSMIKIFAKTYGDEALSTMLISAKRAPATEVVASKLQTELLKVWQSSNKSPEDVFTLLKFDLDGLLVNPMLKTWTKYLDDFNVNNPMSKKSMIKIFAKTYGDEALSTMLISAKRAPATEVVASKLQTELLKVWQSSYKSPEDVFTLLKFDLDGLLVNPMFKTWTKYLDDFNVNNPISKKSVIKILTNTYGDEALSKMLNAAKTDSKTTKDATDLQGVQLKYWLNKGKQQREVYKFLDVKGTSADNANRALWKQYVRDYNKKWITSTKKTSVQRMRSQD